MPDKSVAAQPVEFSGWGRHPIRAGLQRISEDLQAITRGAQLCRGLGRSYGDAALPARSSDVVAVSVRADRLLSFDGESGRIRAEAGLSLRELNRLFLPRGWFSPVSPGTEMVTLGGMVAADVHGKNHHVSGTFGRHVSRLRMRVADDRFVDCSRDEHADLFQATLGGMGLTGHVLEVEFNLERIASPWIWSETERVGQLTELLQKLREASASWPFTVAWSDWSNHGEPMGRGIVMRGRWATRDEASCGGGPSERYPRWVPWSLASRLVCPATIRAFNAMYYAKHGARMHRGIVSPFAFFYPLDAVRDWNRAYGQAGFTQYQCVLPAEDALSGTARLMEVVRREKAPVSLCVIKDFGPEGEGMISFPRPGLTLALDLPIEPGRTDRLIESLNARVIADGGRIYLAKDALSRREQIEAMDSRLPEWKRVRRAWDPEQRLRSAQSVRLLGDSP